MRFWIYLVRIDVLTRASTGRPEWALGINWRLLSSHDYPERISCIHADIIEYGDLIAHSIMISEVSGADAVNDREFCLLHPV